MAKTKRTVHCKTIISPDEKLSVIFGKEDIAYTDMLKVLWNYMKAHKLYRTETI